MKFKFINVVLFLFLFSILKLSAHPGWGMVFDSQGNLFFVDVPNNYIWKYSNSGDLSVYKSNIWSHNIEIDVNDNLIVEYEQYSGHRYSGVIKIYPDGSEEQIIKLTDNPEIFLSGEGTIDLEGNIYYPYQNNIYKYSNGVTELFINSSNFSGIQNLNFIENCIFVSDNGSIKKVGLDSTVETIADNLLIANPPDNPFPGDNNPALNRIYTIEVDQQNNLYAAYHGNSRVLRIDKNKKVDEIYYAEGPWYPVGLTFYNNDLYIMDIGHDEYNNMKSIRIVKWNENGITTIIQTNNDVTNIKENNENSIEYKIKLNQNYPNPFNGETTISYYLPKDSHIHLNIYSSNGELIKNLYHGTRASGNHKFIWNGKDKVGNDISSGVYYLSLNSNKQYSVKKIIYLK